MKVLMGMAALPLAVLFALATGPSVNGQNQPQDKPDKKQEKKGKVFKGEIKVGIHPYEMNAGQNYMIVVKCKNFYPYVQIRDKTNRQVYYSRSGGRRVGQYYFSNFSYTPSKTDTFNIFVSPSGPPRPAPGAVNVALEYTVEIDTYKPLLSVNGQITKNDPKYPFRKGSHHKVHKVKMVKGKTYQIDMRGSFDTYLFLEDAMGNMLSRDDDGGDGLNSRIYFSPPKTDTFRVIATTFGSGRTGNYTLTISDSPINIGNQPGGVINPGFPGGAVPIPINPGNNGVPPAKIQPFPNPPIQIKPGIKIQPGGIQIQPDGTIKIQPGGFQVQPGQFQVPPRAADVAPAPADTPQREEEKRN